MKSSRTKTSETETNSKGPKLRQDEKSGKRRVPFEGDTLEATTGRRSNW